MVPCRFWPMAGGVGEADVDGDVVGLVDRAEDVLDAAPDRRRGDAIGLVIGRLLQAAPAGLLHRARDRAGDRVGIEHHLAIDVARRAANRLHQRGLRAQKAFLVGVEDGDEGAFGNVEPLAQEVDADQRVEGAKAQVADNLDPLDGVDVGMHVAHPHAVLVQIFGQVLGHPLGQHSDERAVAAPRDLLDLAQKVVDLVAGLRGLRGLRWDYGDTSMIDHFPVPVSRSRPAKPPRRPAQRPGVTPKPLVIWRGFGSRCLALR